MLTRAWSGKRSTRRKKKRKKPEKSAEQRSNKEWKRGGWVTLPPARERNRKRFRVCRLFSIGCRKKLGSGSSAGASGEVRAAVTGETSTKKRREGEDKERKRSEFVRGCALARNNRAIARVPPESEIVLLSWTVPPPHFVRLNKAPFLHPPSSFSVSVPFSRGFLPKSSLAFSHRVCLSRVAPSAP